MGMELRKRSLCKNKDPPEPPDVLSPRVRKKPIQKQQNNRKKKKIKKFCNDDLGKTHNKIRDLKTHFANPYLKARRLPP